MDYSSQSKILAWTVGRSQIRISVPTNSIVCFINIAQDISFLKREREKEKKKERESERERSSETERERMVSIANYALPLTY